LEDIGSGKLPGPEVLYIVIILDTALGVVIWRDRICYNTRTP